jgi:hypothetical protein
MGCRSKLVFVMIFILTSSSLFFGCFSYQMLKRTDGGSFTPADHTLRVDESTLDEALSKLGAPDRLVSLEGRDVLLYRRIVFRQHRLSFGASVFDTWSRGIDMSVFGGLEGYDTLALFFTPDGILRQSVIEKAADRPFLKTMLKN